MKECSERVSDLTEITQHESGRSSLELKPAGSRPARPQLLSCLAVASVDRQSLQGYPQPPFPSVCFEARPPGSMEKAMATHSSSLAWKIPWTEEPGRLQSMGSLGLRHD